MSGFSSRNVRYPRYQDTAFFQLWTSVKSAQLGKTFSVPPYTQWIGFSVRGWRERGVGGGESQPFTWPKTGLISLLVVEGALTDKNVFCFGPVKAEENYLSYVCAVCLNLFQIHSYENFVLILDTKLLHPLV